MKNIIFIICLIFTISSCKNRSDSSEDTVIPMPKEFAGKWKIIEVCEGGTGTTTSPYCNWVSYDSGKHYDIQYNTNGTFYDNLAISNCSKGIFYFSDSFNILYIKNQCQNKESNTKIISLTNNEMITYDSLFEGINTKYQKITE